MVPGSASWIASNPRPRPRQGVLCPRRRLGRGEGAGRLGLRRCSSYGGDSTRGILSDSFYLALASADSFCLVPSGRTNRSKMGFILTDLFY